MTGNRILILFFHPRFEDSRTQRKLVDAVSSLENVTIRDMYELYPDFEIDIAAEQELLLSHDMIIWQHPMYWYNCPPLMKQWLDLVLEYGWAYGKGGDKLSGKCVMNVLSSAGTFEIYQKEGRNRFTYRELLSPFDQTAFLCEMVYLPPFIVPGANKISGEELEVYADKYKEIVRFLQSDNIDVEKLSTAKHFNDFNSNKWQDQFYRMP